MDMEEGRITEDALDFLNPYYDLLLFGSIWHRM